MVTYYKMKYKLLNIQLIIIKWGSIKSLDFFTKSRQVLNAKYLIIRLYHIFRVFSIGNLWCNSTWGRKTFEKQSQRGDAKKKSSSKVKSIPIKTSKYTI